MSKILIESEPSEDILFKISELYNLIEAKEVSVLLSLININYDYIYKFIAFSKNINPNICLTILPKKDFVFSARKDLKQCLDIYGHGYKHPILYVPCQINDNTNGPLFNDVYIMFLCKDENQLLDLLFKFDKLKVFI